MSFHVRTHDSEDFFIYGGQIQARRVVEACREGSKLVVQEHIGTYL